jgi:thiol-disulfide isomerase/thioredoxin
MWEVCSVKFVRLVGLVIAALVVLAGCVSPADTARPGSGTPTAPQSAGTGSDPLQFTAQTVDGQEFSGQSLSGKPAVLWFWAPWCPTCWREAPLVGKIARANPAVTFVGVAALDEVPAMQEFVATFDLGSFPHLADPDASVWQRFGVTVQPAYAFIGADGSVDVVKGTLSEQELAQRLSTLTAA